MIKIYTDASYDSVSQLGCYCLVVVTDTLKDFAVEDIDNCKSSTEAEYAGIIAALAISAKTDQRITIYCDSMAAIKKAQSNNMIPTNVSLEHFRGHQLGSPGVVIDDDVKRHHFADVMAGAELDRRLAS